MCVLLCSVPHSTLTYPELITLYDQKKLWTSDHNSHICFYNSFHSSLKVLIIVWASPLSSSEEKYNANAYIDNRF